MKGVDSGIVELHNVVSNSNAELGILGGVDCFQNADEF